ncbi:unnamed protein product [Prorocentrum cordatum]|uniref:Uncharacterized protein n=1 Tax=Prorocentrum cordatum TaxID=2364126 RepID=A0ABN9S5V4_9DINO|nr:unnamed protein product [Polarella glacialis]
MSGHTVATCPSPGAAVAKSLKAKISRLEKTSAKPRTGQLRASQPKSFKKLRRQRSKLHSAGHSEKRAIALQANLEKKNLFARGRRGGATNKDLLYFRCNDWGCHCYRSVVKFSKIPCKLIGQLRCVQLRSLLESYTDAAGQGSASARKAAKSAYCGYKVAHRLHRYLRGLEADAGDKENESRQLGGEIEPIRNVEGDGALARKIRVISKSTTWRTEIAEAKKRTIAYLRLKACRAKKRSCKFVEPKRYMVHVRYVGLCERGGRVAAAPLPVRVVPPGTAPPPEAQGEVLKSGIMNRLVRKKKVFLFSDGALAWPKIVEQQNKAGRNFALSAVVHQKRQCTKLIAKKKRGQSRLAGTQAMYSRWKYMKSYIPRTLKAAKGRAVNPELRTYIMSWQWRQNLACTGAALWESVASLAGAS